MKSIAFAVLAIILLPGILQVEAAKKPKKFCRGKNGIKYPQNEGYKDGCTQFMCVKKGKKLKLVSIPVPNCVDGAWSAWSSWSDCTSTCGTATKTRERTCSNPAPTNGGNPCPGLKKQIDECSLPACGPEDNVNVTALEMKVESLTATVESLLALVTKQGTCMSDFTDSINSIKGDINVNKASININKADVSSNKAGISSNKVNINVNEAGINTTKADVISNKASIVSNTATYSSIQATATNLETCLADINSVKCPSSKDGKTSVSDAIMKNKEDIQYHHTDSIYFIAGGYGANKRDMELYHPTMANLSCSMSPPPLNNGWYYHTTFYYNNTIHLYGGIYGTASTCVSYSINTEEWKTHTLSTSRKYASSVVLKQRVFIIGGRDTSDNYVGAESTPLPLTADRPVLTPELNLDYKGYYQCTTKVDEDTLLVIGGVNPGYLSSVVEYNAKTRTTTSLPSMKQRRSRHGCAMIEMDNTKWIIVAGGYNTADKYIKTTEMLQMGGRSWKPLGNLNVARAGLSLAVTQRGVMSMGGYDGSRWQGLSSVELLDWSAMSWRIVQPSLSKSRMYFGGAVEIPASMFDCRG